MGFLTRIKKIEIKKIGIWLITNYNPKQSNRKPKCPPKSNSQSPSPWKPLSSLP